MGRWSGPVLIALCAPAAGCLQTEPCGPAPAPTGAKGTLRFGLETKDDLGAGLAEKVLIPDYVSPATEEVWTLTDPDTTHERECSDAYRRDFDGTTLEVVGDDVLGVESMQQLQDGSYQFVARCTTTGYTAGEARTGHLSVTIRAGDEVRYADTLSIRCWQITGLSLKLSVPTIDQILYVGGFAFIYHFISHDGVALAGSGFEVRGTDPLVTLHSDTPGFASVDAVREGMADVTLGIGTLEATVPVEILPRP